MPVRSSVGAGTLQQYLDQRCAEHRSVSPTSRRMLQRATESVETVRRQIPMRGNVHVDNDQTGREAARRLYATRFTVSGDMLRRFRDLGVKTPPGLQDTTLTAASARVTGSGNCKEFRSDLMIEAGKRLQRGEALVIATNDAGDHTFVQLESPRPDGTVRRVVLDAWANGPPILAEDCAFAQDNPGRLGARIERRRDAWAADRVAAALVRSYNSDPKALSELKEVLGGAVAVRAASVVPIFDEMHVSGANVADLKDREQG